MSRREGNFTTMTSLDEQRRIVAYLDSFPLSRDLRQARLASLPALCTSGRLQSQTQEELDALSSSPSAASGIPSVLDQGT